MFFLLLLCFLTGCTKKELEQLEGTAKVYYLNKDETALVTEIVELESDRKERQVEELIQILKEPPSHTAYRNVLPEHIAIIDYSFGEANQLILNFDVSYYELSGIAEILCRAAIVKTFCSLEEVEDVEFYINDQPLLLALETPVGMMSSEDFIINTGTKMNLTVYFANEDGTKLKEYHRDVIYNSTLSPEQLVIKLLIQGPDEKDKEVKPTLPEGTKLLKVNVKEGVCYVNFNEKFLEKHPDVTEEVAIYSIVNSLIELGDISKVQFLIEGEQKKNFQNLDLSIMYERNLSIVETGS